MFDEFSVPAAALRPGRNVLAVEVHQNSPTSSDLGFDLELSAVTRPPAAALAPLEEAQKSLKQETLKILQNPPPASASALAEFYEATRK